MPCNEDIARDVWEKYKVAKSGSTLNVVDVITEALNEKDRAIESLIPSEDEVKELIDQVLFMMPIDYDHCLGDKLEYDNARNFLAEAIHNLIKERMTK